LKIEERNPGYEIRPLKFTPRDTPHSTIETNRTCNIRCLSCYNLDRSHVKTLKQVKGEIDLICRKRNLQALTLLGGEPTLHPDIAEIIRYVKSKRVICQILTNGIALLEDRDGGFLDELVAAGIDKVLLHIDSGQSHVHKDIDETRRALFDELERRRVHFSLSITVYNDYRNRIPALVRRYAGYRCFDGILAILARDPEPPYLQDTQMAEEYQSISRELHIEPSGYVPSNLDDGDVGWLVYLYYLNSGTGRTFALSPGVHRLIRKLYRMFSGRELFAIGFPRFSFFPAFCLAGILECTVRPGRLAELISLLRNSRQARSLRFQYIVIQNPPEYDEERRAYRFCYHCPDATIRNGKLTPVCVADQVNPLPGGAQSGKVDEELRRAVYRHLKN
jgi:hypothetical protein